MKGKLFLIPTTLGDTSPLDVMPATVKTIVDSIDYFIVENEKSARRFIKKISPEKSQESLKIKLLDKYSKDLDTNDYLDVCEEGISIGLLSDAGVPAVADPGAMIVELAHRKDLKVVPLVGPSSILMAIMGSGMNGQSFAFNGYLPIDKGARKKKIKELERLSFDKDQSQLFIETPYRNMKMLEDLLQSLGGGTRLCIAADITLKTEYIKTRTIAEWKRSLPEIHKRPAIFIIHK